MSSYNYYDAYYTTSEGSVESGVSHLSSIASDLEETPVTTFSGVASATSAEVLFVCTGV